MSDTVQEIKDKLSIVEVVSPYVKLTKAGKNYKGLSPFNKEKTPSFFVSPDRGTYYCFSSGQGGDMFSFIEKMEGVDFKGALKILAEKAGVTLSYSKGQSEKYDRLREAMARAEAFYTEKLTKEGEAYTYAVSRGLTDETISSWGLGYAPDSWRDLFEHLSRLGFSVEELLASGLIKEADQKRGTYYDRFRNRLMFPIKDAAGRTVAFTGRALNKDDQAKYLNSPETPLFKKSQILFAMDRAKDAIRERGFTLLVEGQFDLILMHQIGFKNTVALSGTALSPEHIALLKRYSDNLMLALDADRAGLQASLKNAHEALRSGMRVKAVRLPQGFDPADLAQKTPQDLVRRIKEAEPIIEFILSVLLTEEKDQHKLVLSVEKTVLPLITVIPSALEREHFLNVVARTIGVSVESVRTSLPTGEAREEKKEDVLKKEETTREDVLAAALSLYPDSALAKHIDTEYSQTIGSSLRGTAVPERALFEVSTLLGESPQEHDLDDVLYALKRSHITKELEEATNALRRAEGEKNQQAIEDALTRCKEISSKLANLSRT